MMHQAVSPVEISIVEKDDEGGGKDIIPGAVLCKHAVYLYMDDIVLRQQADKKRNRGYHQKAEHRPFYFSGYLLALGKPLLYFHKQPCPALDDIKQQKSNTCKYQIPRAEQ